MIMSVTVERLSTDRATTSQFWYLSHVERNRNDQRNQLSSLR